MKIDRTTAVRSEWEEREAVLLVSAVLHSVSDNSSYSEEVSVSGIGSYSAAAVFSPKKALIV